MKLPVPSIRKLFREHFPGDSPIIIAMKNRSATAKMWQDTIAAIEGTHVTQHPGDRDSRSRTLCRFTIPDPHESRQYLRRNELRLEHNDDHALILKSDAGWETEQVAVVSDVAELESFVRSVLARYSRRNAGSKKREKVRDFKAKAIMAQVRTLAREEKFDYATQSDTQKLKLFVKLTSSSLIEIHIPFSQFEKNLPRLRTTILSMRELYEDGLRFKVATMKALPWTTDWTKHDE